MKIINSIALPAAALFLTAPVSSFANTYVGLEYDFDKTCCSQYNHTFRSYAGVEHYMSDQLTVTTELGFGHEVNNNFYFGDLNLDVAYVFNDNVELSTGVKFDIGNDNVVIFSNYNVDLRYNY